MFDLSWQNQENSYVELFDNRYYRDSSPFIFYVGFIISMLLISTIPVLVLISLQHLSKFIYKLANIDYIIQLFMYSFVVFIGFFCITIILGYIKLKLTGNSKPFFEYKYENTDKLNISIKFYPTLF